MSGFPGWSWIYADGWYLQDAGIASVYLSIVDEGFLSSTTDTPANTPFLARILNPDQFYIAQEASTWVDGGSSSTSSYGTLVLDNRDGKLNPLLTASLRDTTLELRLVTAAAAGSLAAGTVEATAIIDAVRTDDADSVTLLLRDVLTKYDKPLRLRRLPPYVDSAAAGKTVPLSFGACRNVAPLLIDSPTRTYLLHDAPIANIAAVRDMGAELDPLATPPQYTPAENGSGFALETDAVGKLTVDCSTEGAQVVIPTAVDVLGGIGDFGTWTGTAPNGWTWSAHTGGVLTKLGTVNGYPQDYVASISSTTEWLPSSGKFGDWIKTNSNLLSAGVCYRITCKIWQTSGAAPYYVGGLPAGIQLRTDLSQFADGAISPNGQPLTVRLAGDYSYSFTYRVPAGADRPVYVIANSAAGLSGNGMGAGGGIVYNVEAEELGQYLELPVAGITLVDYFDEILYTRAGETGTWSDTDLAALDAATGYTWGVHFDEAPTILDALRAPLDSFGAFLFTDADGLIRVRRLNAPEAATVVVAVDDGCIDRATIRQESFDATGLTTQIGARRNWSTYGDSDFVTDTVSVPPDVRARYKRTSQYLQTSSVYPAGRYSHAVGAPALDSLLDNPDQAQAEIDRVVGMFAARIVGTAIYSGQIVKLSFDVLHDGVTLGANPSIAPRNLLLGDGVKITLSDLGYTGRVGVLVGVQRYPFGQRMTLTVLLPC